MKRKRVKKLRENFWRRRRKPEETAACALKIKLTIRGRQKYGMWPRETWPIQRIWRLMAAIAGLNRNSSVSINNQHYLAKSGYGENAKNTKTSWRLRRRIELA